VAGRKARKPASGRSERRLHAVSLAGELRSREATPSPHTGLAAYAGQRRIGVSPGKLGFEAFDRHDRSLGIFPTMKVAFSAVSEAARAFSGGAR